jgi:hypothetical protein
MVAFHACQSAAPDVKSTLYEPYPNVIFDMGNIHDGNRAIADAFSEYEKGNYEKAYTLFNTLTFEEKTPDIHFYTGMSLFASGKFEESVGPLRIGGKYGSQFQEAAEYYLVIADYERGKKEIAFDRLKVMLAQNRLGGFSEKGQQLVKYIAADPDIKENFPE